MPNLLASAAIDSARGVAPAAIFALAFHGYAMALDDTAVTEPRYFAAEETLEARKAYAETLKKYRAITSARDAIQCASLKGLESQSPINRFRSPAAAEEGARDCSKLVSGQIVELKECDPLFHACRFAEKDTPKEFWTDLYNVSPEL
jgi:hypothetical protein